MVSCPAGPLVRAADHGAEFQSALRLRYVLGYRASCECDAQLAGQAQVGPTGSIVLDRILCDMCPLRSFLLKF